MHEATRAEGYVVGAGGKEQSRAEQSRADQIRSDQGKNSTGRMSKRIDGNGGTKRSKG